MPALNSRIGFISFRLRTSTAKFLGLCEIVTNRYCGYFKRPSFMKKNMLDIFLTNIGIYCTPIHTITIDTYLHITF